MTNDKQRLVELLEESGIYAFQTIENNCCEEKLKLLDKVNELRADYLLANGVIVPPCKVGDIVWCNIEGFDHPFKGMIRRVSVSKDFTTIAVGIDGYFEQHYLINDFGKKVFPTKEEALNNIQNGNSCEGGAE
jgi:hypothetical protein